MPELNEKKPPADEVPVERWVGRLDPERAATPLGVHWFGGRPYMLTSAAPTPKKRMKGQAHDARVPE